MKVTPAHDKNDYEAGLRNNLPQMQVIGEDGRMTDAAGAEFSGLDRFEARKKVVEMLREQGLLVKVEDHVHNVGVHGKCDTDIEPMVSRQWFVKIEPLATPAIEAVRNGDVHHHAAERGKRRTSTGWRTSTTGRSRASSGGAIASPRSTARTATPPCRWTTSPRARNAARR